MEGTRHLIVQNYEIPLVPLKADIAGITSGTR
jgi:hypothetical protein